MLLPAHVCSHGSMSHAHMGLHITCSRLQGQARARRPAHTRPSPASVGLSARVEPLYWALEVGARQGGGRLVVKCLWHNLPGKRKCGLSAHLRERLTQLQPCPGTGSRTRLELLVLERQVEAEGPRMPGPPGSRARALPGWDGGSGAAPTPAAMHPGWALSSGLGVGEAGSWQQPGGPPAWSGLAPTLPPAMTL